jgi:hypothetical protein
MARLGHCRSKQHHHMCHRSANGAIRIPSCQSFLHRTLRKQSVELATENPDCELCMSPAIPYLVVRAVRAWPHANRARLTLRSTCIHNMHFHGLLWIPAEKPDYRKVAKSEEETIRSWHSRIVGHWGSCSRSRPPRPTSPHLIGSANGHRARGGSLRVRTILVGACLTVSTSKHQYDDGTNQWDQANEKPPPAAICVVESANQHGERWEQRRENEQST